MTWDRLAEILMAIAAFDYHTRASVLAPPGNRHAVVLLTRRLHLSKGQLVDVEGRLQTRQWDEDAGRRPVGDQLLPRGYPRAESVASPVATGADDPGQWPCQIGYPERGGGIDGRPRTL